MSEVETELDRQMSEVEIDVPELDPSAPIVDLIQAIRQKEYNTAEDLFRNAIDDKIGDQLDQARAKIAGQMFNGDEAEDEYEDEEDAEEGLSPEEDDEEKV
jgi:hypothetical protein